MHLPHAFARFAGDYKDPGWYRHAAGTQAYEGTGEVPTPPRADDDKSAVAADGHRVFTVRKESKHDH